MEHKKSKTFTQFMAGLFGGVIFGVLGFSSVFVYGQTGSCEIFSAFFDLNDKNACIDLTALVSLILGSVLGITLFHFTQLSDSGIRKFRLFFLLGTIFLPLLYALFMLWSPFDKVQNPGTIFEPYVMMVIGAGLGIFILFSALISGLIIFLLGIGKLIDAKKRK